MSEQDKKLLDVITHYQDALNRYVSHGEERKIMHCLDKLQRLPITVSHLEETGVGRSVNSLRKIDGNVGDNARSLVNQWKEMVEQYTQHNNNDNEDVDIGEDSSPEIVDYNKVQSKKDLNSGQKSGKRKYEETSLKIAENDSESDDRKKHSSKNRKNKDTKKVEGSKQKKKQKIDEKITENELLCKNKLKQDESGSKNTKKHNTPSIGSKITKQKLQNIDSIDSGSGASFAEALGMLEPLPTIKTIKKKTNKTTADVSPRKPPPEKCELLSDDHDSEFDDVPHLLAKPPKFDALQINISSLLPTLTPNYRPIANNPLLNENPRHKTALTEYECLSNVIMSKNAR